MLGVVCGNWGLIVWLHHTILRNLEPIIPNSIRNFEPSELTAFLKKINGQQWKDLKIGP